jgi:hypothetical protein
VRQQAGDPVTNGFDLGQPALGGLVGALDADQVVGAVSTPTRAVAAAAPTTRSQAGMASGCQPCAQEEERRPKRREIGTLAARFLPVCTCRADVCGSAAR